MRRCALCGERRIESRLVQVDEHDWICEWRTGCEHRVAKLERTIEALARQLEPRSGRLSRHDPMTQYLPNSRFDFGLLDRWWPDA